jgi:GTP-binding protein
MNKNYYKLDLDITAGNGGSGCVSFRRERKVAKGGPDGGDGGAGGSVYLKTSMDLLTLNDLRYHRIWKAGNGRDGSSQNKTGKNGEDVFINIPIGTQILYQDEVVLDIVEPGIYLIASGGKGGLGNQHFTSPTLQAPAIATKGDLGESKRISLILKYMANIGFVGLPNAGKSTLVHLLSRAPVKIGDYAFSTINPVLGVIKGTSIVVADLPGLIEGAHLDRGLGHEFLQHLFRCKLLVHVLDASDPAVFSNFDIIQNEIREYDPQLMEKTEVVCLNKVDLIDSDQLVMLKEHFMGLGKTVITTSEYDESLISEFKNLLISLATTRVDSIDNKATSESD